MREAPGTSFKLADLLARPVPRFRIVSPASGSHQRGGRAEVKIAIEAVPDPDQGRSACRSTAARWQEITPEIGSGGFGAGERNLDVPLGKGRNEVRITLTNAIGDKTETLHAQPRGRGDLDRRGTLYILAIGVTDYPGLGNTCGERQRQLRPRLLRRRCAQAGRGGREAARARPHKVVKRVLVNGGRPDDAPTAANIIDAIDLLKQAKETDTVVLFIAGHGYNDGPNYRFLATNAERAGGALRGSTVVPWQILQEAVEARQGPAHPVPRHLPLGQRLQPDASATPPTTPTSSPTRRPASTRRRSRTPSSATASSPTRWSRAWTARAGSHQREISTKELADYVVKRGRRAGQGPKGEQEPQYFKGRDAEDYVLARW